MQVAKSLIRNVVFVHLKSAGRDEATVRAYIRDQEVEDQRLDKRNLWR